ncbi:hypothetical protein C5E45_02690 [Nocardia nova]|uniref:DUF4197 domain-containing protein n=2 Tax=Nocardia nova TaxID=37330 RepID=A0A2S6AXW2_9NOCA|nr:hypothetical protein C5E41_00810 [Nocardia nova]PPJ40014.1 hypothetical protein C5E45_02690 [Nocardia nova]
MLGAVTLVVAGAVTGGVIAATRGGAAPTDIAIVNADTGPAGARIVKTLQSESDTWTVAEPGARTADHAAVITLPADLSASLATLATAQPRRAQLTVATNEHADTAAVDDAVAAVTRRIAAAGVDRTLAAVANARGSMQQAAFTSQLLDAGVRTAADAAGQFTGGAQQMLSFLDSEATNQAENMAGAFDATGLTIGQISAGANTMSTGLDQILPLLRALPFAADPQVTDIIGKLEAIGDYSTTFSRSMTKISVLPDSGWPEPSGP